jgi:ankyrin repeat protein
MLTILKLAGWRGEATPTASASTENAETRAMASPIDFLVNAVTHDGGTALHEAARNNQLEAVRVLLKAGFDPAARDSSGRTPLHIAEAEDFQQVAVVLLEADRTLDENKPGVMSFGTDEEAAAMSKLRVDPELEELERQQREQLQAAATAPKPAAAAKPTVQAPVDVDEVE